MTTPEAQNQEHITLIQSLIDTHDDLVIITCNAQPIFLNRSFMQFFGLRSLQEFKREIGSMEYRFVPHENYFNVNKMLANETWTHSIEQLEKEKRIVSMINTQTKPHAFAVEITKPIEGYELIQFKDISQMLIKRILVENDASLNKESGAYSKEYFLHTSYGFMDTAALNEKLVAISAVKLPQHDQKVLKELATAIKSFIRSEDMLVQWDSGTFILAYLSESEQGAKRVSEKISQAMKEHNMRFATIIQHESEKELEAIVKRALEKL
jgi:hypothetical protein